MAEGSLQAPVRHILDWQNPDFYDREKIDAELYRVFDICHGCRRCFNLCDSFPRLFDMIDATPSGETHDLPKSEYGKVVDACTLCDLCFMTKCPYVPPHEFDLDFPHLMLRHKAAEHRAGKTPIAAIQLTETDRNNRLAGLAAPIANWAADPANARTRGLLEKVGGVHREAALPKFNAKTLKSRAKGMADALAPNPDGPAYGQRKVAVYATCYGNYNNPEIGEATLKVLAKQGCQVEVVYPGCCGMPQFEQGDLARVAENAKRVAYEFRRYVDEGYDIVALVPSCALMLKFEWPLLVPDDENVKALSAATRDVAQYVVELHKAHGLAPGLEKVEGGVTLHLACHARAQNMGAKAADMLRLIPETQVGVIERCSGHGGSWGVMKEFYEVALKVGKPVARQAAKDNRAHLASECPLAGLHIAQGMQKLGGDAPKTIPEPEHPIQIFARAYGL